MLVALEDLDVNYTKQKIEQKKDNRDGHIRKDSRSPAQAGVSWCIWRTYLPGLLFVSVVFFLIHA